MSYTTTNNVVINKLTLNQYKTLQSNNQVNANEVYVINDYMGDYVYICNGSTDNVNISTIVKAFLNENTAEHKTLELTILGSFGATSAASGTGASNNAYKWFDLSANTSSRRVILNFANAGRLNITVPNGTTNILFYTGVSDITIRDADFISDNANTDTMITAIKGTGNILFENCRGWIRCYLNSTIADHGTFNNCRFTSRSSNTNAMVFNTTGCVIANSCEFYAYTGNGTFGACVYHGPSATTAVTTLNMCRMPTKAITGYSQTEATRINHGYFGSTNLITALSLTTASSATKSITGTFAISK